MEVLVVLHHFEHREQWNQGCYFTLHPKECKARLTIFVIHGSPPPLDSWRFFRKNKQNKQNPNKY